MPHHVTQRGTRRQDVFFGADDFKTYLSILQEQCEQEHVDVWSYCLMPNHVHLILVPKSTTGLSRVIGKAHKRYAGLINHRMDWTGHLWQERFYSCPMDESHTLMAIRYVEQNPLRAGLVRRPEEWNWSSASSHIHGDYDALLSPTPLESRIGDWSEYLQSRLNQDEIDKMRQFTNKGTPVVGKFLQAQLEDQLGFCLSLPLRGRPKFKKGASHL